MEVHYSVPTPLNQELTIMIVLKREIRMNLKVRWEKSVHQYVARVGHWPHLIGRDNTLEGALLALLDSMKDETELAILERNHL